MKRQKLEPREPWVAFGNFVSSRKARIEQVKASVAAKSAGF
jgi:redox-sensitive bicupin YhaK (pirin superfamily)